MRVLSIVCALALLTSCGSDEFGFSQFRCDIVESFAWNDFDRQHDLQQCWNIESTSSQSEALDICLARVIRYAEERYVFDSNGEPPHTIIYQVSEGLCAG